MALDGIGYEGLNTATEEVNSKIEGLKSGTIKEWLVKIVAMPDGIEQIIKIDNILNSMGLEFEQLNKMLNSMDSTDDSVKSVEQSLVDLHTHVSMKDKEGTRIVMDELQDACKALEVAYDGIELPEAA